MDLDTFRNLSVKRADFNKKFLGSLRKKDQRTVDSGFHRLHEEVFAETDCLTCANCCKTTSPIFYSSDIERIAKHLRMRPGEFTEKYLRIDEDNDFVLRSAPCPFLDKDNHCRVYEFRPRACREYPHTDRKKMTQLLELTYKNTLVCPAVLEIVDRLSKSGI